VFVTESKDNTPKGAFDPARIVLAATEHQLLLHVEGLVIGPVRVARVSMSNDGTDVVVQNIVPGASLGKLGAQVTAVRKDGVVLRMPKGQLVFAPKHRETRIVMEN
jgi:hypothetical protein